MSLQASSHTALKSQCCRLHPADRSGALLSLGNRDGEVCACVRKFVRSSQKKTSANRSACLLSVRDKEKGQDGLAQFGWYVCTMHTSGSLWYDFCMC